MAHPKHRVSKQRRDKRRTHDVAVVPTLATCSNCGATIMYHRVCPECGYYRGRQIIDTLDLSAVAVLHELSHLPVVVDPSHATGAARYVKPMALAAAACGADGLMIEVHNDPAHARCDGPQSLTPEQFDDVARAVMKVRAAVE